MATFLQGQTFGATEQVTNTKLHNLVANASISSILAAELINSFLSSLASGHGKVPPQNFYNVVTPATNASLIDVSIATTLKVFYATYGSIATFINARVGHKFTIIAQQASFPAVLDTGSFKLSALWAPAKQYDNLTLEWDGSVFVEIGRTAT